ncbi:MAG TPA: thioesterase family protein [Ruminiclostridium sp.]|nr:thioesterase family protein [Ruminiclostridium sp.]
MISETKITVRYAETDQMGIVHHSVYPIWFEAARTDFFKKAGYSYAKVEEQGFYLPVVELNCKYQGSALYGGDVVIKTRISGATFVRLFFDYEVIDPKTGRLLVKGKTVHAWTDKSMHPVSIKKKSPEIYKAIMSLISNG